MGQFFSCWICGSKTKVISLTRKENSTFAATDGPHTLLSSSQIQFYQPSLRTGGDFKQFTKHTCISNCLDNNANSLKIESLSNCSSLATISLGSAQNLNVTTDEERDWRDGAINNRLQEQDVDYDHERQSSLPNIGKRLRTETNEIRRNPRAFSSMGRMALNFLKSKESKSNIGSRNNSQYSGSVAEIPTGRNCVVCTSWNERAEIELNTEIEKPQLIRTSPLYPGELSDSSSSETQTENNSVIKIKPKECPHGIILSAEHKFSEENGQHVVQCLRCERPDSCGGRALKGLVQFRRNDKIRRKEMETRRNERIQVERDRRRQQEKDVQEALRKFAEAESTHQK